MPRQNTSPADYPQHVLAQIEQLAQHIVRARKARGETQAQWAQQLGISQPTMARIERGDPSIATATYVMCLWLVNPELNLLRLLEPDTYAVSTVPVAHEATPDTLKPSSSVADEFATLLAQWKVPAL